MTSLLRDPVEAPAGIAWRSTAAEPTPDLVDPALEALKRDNEELTAALAKALADGKSGASEAYAKGKADAAKAFQRDEAARLEALAIALTSLVDEGKAKFKDLERLALVLCETALDGVFDSPADMMDLSARAIALQMRGLRRDTVLQLRVSADDFPSEDSLRELEGNLALKAATIRIEHDAHLKSGESQIQLRLGHIELSLPGHWAELKSALRAMAGNGERS